MTERGTNHYACDADRYILFTVQREFDVDLFNDVTKVEIKRRERVGDKIHLQVVTCANGDIPPALQKIVTPKMLTWTETGTWDLATKVYEYHVKTFYLSNIFEMGGRFKVNQTSPQKVEVQYESRVSIKMPLLGGIAEKAILTAQKKNLDASRPKVEAKLVSFSPIFTF